MNIIVAPQASKVISKIAQNPNLGQKIPLLENEPIEYRSFLVNKINKVIYYVDNKNLNIVYVWDTRQDPEKLIDIVRV